MGASLEAIRQKATPRRVAVQITDRLSMDDGHRAVRLKSIPSSSGAEEYLGKIASIYDIYED